MPVTIKLFFDRLRASELLEPDDVESLWLRVPADKRNVAAEKLAPKLVDAGKLTAYQAEALLAGGSDPLVLGEYVVLGKLGSGGMGQVYKAEHRRMKRVVALKVLSSDAVRSPDAVKRFHREVQAAARLLHPNIVTAFDAGDADGVHFLVMECVEGQDLAAISKAAGQLPVDRAVDYILQAARGLAYAHSKGVTHRDIKPANLLIDSDGTLKILDMGLARVDGGAGTVAMREQLTQSGQVMGTLDYMAPEQAYDTRLADGRSDIYSLGCTLYRLLTGETLFGGDSLVQVIMAHREQPVPSLRKLRGDVSPALDAIFQKMLAKKPEDRQASMADLVVALEGLKGGASSAVGSLAPSPAVPESQITNYFQDVASKGSRPLPRQAAFAPEAPAKPVVDAMPIISVKAASSGSTAKGLRLSGDTNPHTDTAGGTGASPSSNRLATDQQPGQRRLGLMIGAAAVGGVLVIAVAVLGWNVMRGGKSTAKEGKNSSQTDKTALTKGATDRDPSKDPPKSSGKSTRSTSKNLPPLPAGMPSDKFPGLLVDPPKLAAFGRWQVETAVPRRPVSSVAWSPDNRKVAIGGDAGELRIYDSQGWRLLNMLLGHTSTVTAVAWSPDGSRLASCGSDNTVRLWRSDGTPGPIVSKRNRPAALAFSPDGEWLAVGSSDKNVGKPELFNANGSPGPACAGITGGILGLAWNDDSRQLVTCSDDKTLRLWNVDGSMGKELKGHGATLRGVSWSRSGHIATVDTAGAVYIHPTDGKAPKEFGKLGARAVAWSPDGKKLAVGFNNNLQIWDAEGKSGEQQPATASVNQVAWSPDGKRLAWTGGGAGVWEPGKSSSFLSIASPAGVLDWEPGGSRFISTHDDDRLRWWKEDGTLEEASTTSSSQLATAAWSPNGQLVAAGGGKSLFLWGADRAPKPAFDPKLSTIRALAWNGASDQLIVGGNAAKLQIWDLGGSSMAELKGHDKKQVTHVDWSKTTGQLATAGSDNTLRFWQPDGAAGPEIESVTISALKWNPDGKELAASVFEKKDRYLRIYSAAGVIDVESKVPSDLRALAWSADGEQLVSGDRAGLLKIWRRNGELVSNLAGHTGEVRAVAWSKEGRLLSSGDDRTIRCWDVASGKQVWIAAATGGENFAAVGVDGKALGPLAVAEKHVAYLVERGGGRVEALVPTEFDRLSALPPAASPTTPDNPTPPTDKSPPLAVAPFDARAARAHQEAWAKHLNLPVESTNSSGLKLVLIPPGEFLMGSSDKDLAPLLESAAEGMKARLEAEMPQRTVRISKPFYLGATEVTIGQFRKFVEATRYRTTAENDRQGGTAWDEEKKEFVRDPKHNWQTRNPSPVADEPVENISHADAVAYCRWLSSQDKATYRLPTEAEWEFAARAGTATPYHFGDWSDSLAQTYEWLDTNGGRRVHPVGKLIPNSFGLYDMLGNAAERCSDIYGPYDAAGSKVVDPTGPTSGDDRVIRSGMLPISVLARSASRHSAPTSDGGAGGLRIVRVVP